MSVIMSFFVVLLILAIGDIVSTKTKAFVPSVFVAALLFVLGFWYGWFPLDVVEKAGMTGPIVSISMYVIIVHMGTLMSIRELCAEWKTIASPQQLWPAWWASSSPWAVCSSAGTPSPSGRRPSPEGWSPRS